MAIDDTRYVTHGVMKYRKELKDASINVYLLNIKIMMEVALTKSDCYNDVLTQSIRFCICAVFAGIITERHKTKAN
ncbi:hypothetical protein CHS0354_021123 [Potamilus streckersoni]|uniref:Uncharacterized protein n=1 Tax=Potamilus streckersoni TaxID=2493646 RepID=A0AAE0SDP5_9BIVA|nr:hypothetical protein CHS0354_021123 [Potamilus streckersoni]